MNCIAKEINFSYSAPSGFDERTLGINDALAAVTEAFVSTG